MKECRSFITVECYTLLLPKSCLTHLFFIQAKAVLIAPTLFVAVAPKPQRTQFSDYAPQRRARTDNCHSMFLDSYSSITLSIPLASLYNTNTYVTTTNMVNKVMPRKTVLCLCCHHRLKALSKNWQRVLPIAECQILSITRLHDLKV